MFISYLSYTAGSFQRNGEHYLAGGTTGVSISSALAILCDTAPRSSSRPSCSGWRSGGCAAAAVDTGGGGGASAAWACRTAPSGTPRWCISRSSCSTSFDSSSWRTCYSGASARDYARAWGDVGAQGSVDVDQNTWVRGRVRAWQANTSGDGGSAASDCNLV